MKKILLLILFTMTSLCIFGQKYSNKIGNRKELLGTWVATNGNKSYEIEFIKATYSHSYAKIKIENSEIVVGSIKYLEDNKVMKNVEMKGFDSPINAYPGGDVLKFELHYSEKDNGLAIYGRVDFDISTDGKTALWHKLRKSTVPNSTKEDFDIPKELTFIKKSTAKSDSNQPVPHFDYDFRKRKLTKSDSKGNRIDDEYNYAIFYLQNKLKISKKEKSQSSVKGLKLVIDSLNIYRPVICT
jgi:hypothetical protein